MEDYTVNIAEYLQRIQFTDNWAVNAETLVRVTRAHLEAVPFENLEVRYEHREPSLEAKDLYNKVVINKRGGYCFELNKLFYLLLKQMGFECYPVPARVVHQRPELRPVSHRATVVVIDGRKWFCDVGFGGAGPKGALRLDTTDVQEVFGDSFVITRDHEKYIGEYAICRIDDGIAQQVLSVQDNAWMDVDFTTFNSYYATYHRSPFKLKRVLYKCTTHGWVSLTENTLVTMENGIRQTVELQSEQEIETVIEQRFGLFVKPL